MIWTITVLEFIASIPKSKEMDVIGYQIIKSCTSSGANYRAACRPKSKNDMINKLKIVEEELDETQYWLEVIELRMPRFNSKSIQSETNELLAIIVASINTLRKSNS
jgi:four helix bundle protein